MSERNEREKLRIRDKRRSDPAYVERERKMLRDRMASLRATLGYQRPDRAGGRTKPWKRRSPNR